MRGFPAAIRFAGAAPGSREPGSVGSLAAFSASAIAIAPRLGPRPMLERAIERAHFLVSEAGRDGFHALPGAAQQVDRQVTAQSVLQLPVRGAFLFEAAAQRRRRDV